MSGSRDFIINFGSLSTGEHEFEFKVDSTFFRRFENSIIQKGDVDVLVVVEKKDSMLLFDFTMEGTVTVPCDRCLEDLDLDIETYNELIVKMGDHHEEESEDVIVISSKEYEIDVSQYIYEYLTLIVPMRNVHDEEEGLACNPEVLKELNKHLPQSDGEHSNDPRWDGLKNINLN
jgi:uncharacterized metal-binding protein YceD (DUF177 family)